MKQKQKNVIRKRRAIRTRTKIVGTGEIPRLSVFRSNRHIYLQLIDDTKGVTVLSASTKVLKPTKGLKKTDQAQAVSELLAEKAKQAGIRSVAFDRGMYRYHGRIKAVADVMRKEGIKI
ncbi:MAG: 50S ribosomal protein L18 [Patescibacteria group bacterium]|nr:50S ribosomal protein L18 [Patescibacteria group bacterium]MCL5224010.1 50S ribosomal protein L18 [Patescibacteria group bacterium]